MTTRPLPRMAFGPAATKRYAFALSLHALSLALGRVALWLLPAEREEPADPLLEFHADAGAPEGALYVDGKLVGTLPGVTRL